MESVDIQYIMLVYGVNIMDIPNLEVLRDISRNIGKEYDLENRLNRYKNLAPELIEFVENIGLPNSEQAIRALFIADFIVAASEVPMGSVDEERYTSVAKAFISGNLRCRSPDALVQMFYFAYKTAILIRRQDLFMAGRGIDRKVALIRIKDSYITPYLHIASEILGKGSCGWELGILSAALIRNFPEIEIDDYITVPEHSKHRSITEPIWNLLKKYADNQKVDTNQNVIIPNVSESKNILLFNSDDTSQISLWGITPSNMSKIQGSVKSIVKSFDKDLKMQDLKLTFLRGSIINSSRKLFILKDLFTSSKPMGIFISPVDEINVSRIRTILNLRGFENDGWKSVFTETEEIIEEKITQEKKIPEPVNNIAPKTEEKTTQEKISFFSKIARIFSRKERKIQTESIPMVKKVEKQSPKKEKKEKRKKKKKLPPFIVQSEFLAQAITIDAVSDIDLFETFDTLREEPEGYSIFGIFETDFKETQTIIRSSPYVEIQDELTTFFNGLEKIIKSINELFSEKMPILFTEAFFMDESNKQKLIISMNGNEDRVVGTIAASFFDRITNWQARGEEKEPLQRRSLHMRTSQFLSARRHTRFDDASKRIFGENFDLEMAKEATINKLIPSFDK